MRRERRETRIYPVNTFFYPVKTVPSQRSNLAQLAKGQPRPGDNDDENTVGNESDDLYIIGAVCLSVCM